MTNKLDLHNITISPPGASQQDMNKTWWPTKNNGQVCKKIQVQNQFSCSLKTLTENFIWMHVLCGAAIKDLGCLHLMRRRRKKVWISSNNEPLMYAISKRNSARHSIQMQMALIGIDHGPNKINTPSVSFVIVVYSKFKKYLSINAAYKKSIRTLLNKSFPFVGARVIFFPDSSC